MTKDGASQQHNNKAASISTNVDTLSTTMNNISISNSKDSVLNNAECGKEAEISSNKKVSTSCVQNVDHKNDIGTREQHTTNNGGTSDTADKNFISDDDLFKVPPPKEDCPICMQPIPYENGICGVTRVYQPCCGKLLCGGCVVAAQIEMHKGNMKRLCPFCRVPIQRSDKEMMKRIKKRLKVNDTEAFFTLGMKYHYGKMGLAQDANKAWELMNRSAELGSVRARYNIAVAFHSGDGVEKNTSKAVHHYKLAAIGGHERARLWLGIIEMSNGHINYAMKHFMIAAKSGLDEALKEVGKGYKAGHVTKDEYAMTLRAHKDSQDEMKSEKRTKSAKFLVE